MLCNRIINFYQNLDTGNISFPEGIQVMNPYKGENTDKILRIINVFYQKFYNDNNPRKLILGINPGRFGAGSTGLMFTDTIRLNENCGIPFNDFHSRELSSDFFYRVIEKFGSVYRFYNTFYIGAVSPLGFLKINNKGREINYNYNDSKELQQAVLPFIKQSLLRQMEFNIQTDVCFCLGTGKNYTFLTKLNSELKLFDKIIALEHPRYILQYKSRQSNQYIEKYIQIFKDYA